MVAVKGLLGVNRVVRTRDIQFQYVMEFEGCGHKELIAETE